MYTESDYINALNERGRGFKCTHCGEQLEPEEVGIGACVPCMTYNYQDLIDGIIAYAEMQQIIHRALNAVKKIASESGSIKPDGSIGGEVVNLPKPGEILIGPQHAKLLKEQAKTTDNKIKSITININQEDIYDTISR